MQLDVEDDGLTRQAHQALVASRVFGRPWFEPPSFDEVVLDWRHEDKAEPKEIWVAEHRGQVTGVATLYLPKEDNTWLAWFDLHVHPDHRRAGHGSALIDRMAERAQAAGRRSLLTEFMVPVDDPAHSYRRFVERHGYSLNHTEVIRHLDLPVADDRLDDLDSSSRPRWEGNYVLQTHVNGVPPELQPSLCEVMSQLIVDAPTGDIEFEPEYFTPARYEEQLALERRMGRTRLTTVALGSSGDVVAYTDLVLPAGAPSTVFQWGTYVHREHRGRRLGMAVKVENLRHLQAEHPGRRRVVTGNDGTNSWMVSINEALGFRIVELCPAYQRKLD
ncbi:GNAT family N-acetyltransferase [Intrasporangium sp. DVR]